MANNLLRTMNGYLEEFVKAFPVDEHGRPKCTLKNMKGVGEFLDKYRTLIEASSGVTNVGQLQAMGKEYDERKTYFEMGAIMAICSKVRVVVESVVQNVPVKVGECVDDHDEQLLLSSDHVLQEAIFYSSNYYGWFVSKQTHKRDRKSTV